MQSPASSPPSESRSTTVYLGLGSNLGDRRRFIEAAVAELVRRGALGNPMVSPLYETDAVADEPQPPYLNGVVRGETTQPAAALLASCLEVESDLGRVRPTGRQKASRTIDIDILLYGDCVIDMPTLTVPHPALLTRAFVLIPLADVAAPGLLHPRTHRALTVVDPAMKAQLASAMLVPASVGGYHLTSGGMMPGEQSDGDGSNQKERRQTERIPLEMWVEETTENERYFRRAGNLSRGGLRLDHTIPLPQGTRVNLTFTLPGDTTPIDVAGEIVSSSGPDDLRMGVKFVSVGAPAQERLDAYLARVGPSK
jgi:2-amino-4-hydroxy-6-hydroxymethyldihydropteridine diphosphokinase